MRQGLRARQTTRAELGERERGDFLATQIRHRVSRAVADLGGLALYGAGFVMSRVGMSLVF
ncbi:hypothetical protein HMPREF1640_00485 [Prevotella sp. S7-1-8]|nr:hypothetical protein HMPREF1640_00485 [Prevotella sp. S7-1-8]